MSHVHDLRPHQTDLRTTQDPPPSHAGHAPHGLRGPIVWGLVVGALQAAAPLALPWLDQATVQALALCMIAGVYVGFAVADGRPQVIAVECAVVGAFVLMASAAVVSTPWVLVFAYTAHGVKDYWQHRRHFVANTRWWPPFCAAVDWLVAIVLVAEIIAGVSLQG